MEIAFSAQVWEWRGPAPFHWVSLPAAESAAVREAGASYGWGAVPVAVRIGGTEWETSLLPKDGGFVLPLKVKVRTAERIDLGDTVAVALRVQPRDGRRANGTGPAY